MGVGGYGYGTGTNVGARALVGYSARRVWVRVRVQENVKQTFNSVRKSNTLFEGHWLRLILKVEWRAQPFYRRY